ncbi:MAG TPA: M23 family metallopeptidase, partial [Myxococcota bacterium]
VEGLAGTIRGNLYNGIHDAGGDANLVNRFVDVFAWNIDFYRQAQNGDTFRVLVEKRFSNDGNERKFLGWGKVVAAEYVNAGTAWRGFAFESKDKQFAGYYDDRGESLERTFLRSPMEVTRITSSYGSRFHPVLKTQKKHEGVDYGAPVGTPIWTVADGIVVEARFSKSAGNMVVVQHVNGLRTEYFHLSKFAEGVRAGSRVTQKQVIGYVGSTGMSTGPHLHFGLLRGNSHIDPGSQKTETAKPMPASYRDEYQTFVAPLMAQLAALTRA